MAILPYCVILANLKVKKPQVGVDGERVEALKLESLCALYSDFAQQVARAVAAAAGTALPGGHDIRARVSLPVRVPQPVSRNPDWPRARSTTSLKACAGTHASTTASTRSPPAAVICTFFRFDATVNARRSTGAWSPSVSVRITGCLCPAVAKIRTRPARPRRVQPSSDSP